MEGGREGKTEGWNIEGRREGRSEMGDGESGRERRGRGREREKREKRERAGTQVSEEHTNSLTTSYIYWPVSVHRYL